MPLKIEIVEDEPEICGMYRRKFKNDGFVVVTAENGQIGLQLAETEKPDIILLDLMMPVMGGEEMLKLLRATDWGKTIPVFVLTNLGDEDTMDQLHSLNIVQYMVKADYTPSQILGVVKQFAATL